MADTSIIARRRKDGTVQYGWSGNGGVFSAVGSRLLDYYNDPESVEYLFGLGQLSSIWEPHSELWGGFFRNTPTGERHWEGFSEREIFSKLWVDIAYFYDLDNIWYYVEPGYFRVKIPLELMANCIDMNQQKSFLEGDFLREVDRRLAEAIRDRYDKDEEFRAYLKGKGYGRKKFMAAMDAVLRMEGAKSWERRTTLLEKNHRSVFDYFDNWAVVVPNKDNTEIRDILLRRKTLSHLETLEWDGRYHGEDTPAKGENREGED